MALGNSTCTEQQLPGDELVQRLQTPERSEGVTRIACIISGVGSPPLVITATMLLVALHAGSGIWPWFALHISLAVLVPVLRLAWQVQRGWITDLDVQLRKERLGPMLFTLLCNATVTLLFLLGGAPQILLSVVMGLDVILLLIFLITLRWKISVHCAMATAAALITLWLTGISLPLLVAVPFIGWSRVYLHRHTVPQTVAGALLSLCVSMVLIALVGGS